MIFVEFGVFPSASFIFVDFVLFFFEFSDSVIDWPNFLDDLSDFFAPLIVLALPGFRLEDIRLVVWIGQYLRGMDWDWRKLELGFVGVNPLRVGTYTLLSSMIMFEDYLAAVGLSLVYFEGWSTIEAAGSGSIMWCINSKIQIYSHQ